jgi:hypothetical protein
MENNLLLHGCTKRQKNYTGGEKNDTTDCIKSEIEAQ